MVTGRFDRSHGLRLNRHFFTGLFILGLMIVSGSAAWGEQIDFNFAGPLGGLPAGFHADLAGSGFKPEWKIVEDSSDDTAAAHPHVLAQTGLDLTDEHFPLCIYDGKLFDNFKLNTRFKIVSGVNEQMAGVLFRFENTSNFYVIRISALGKNISFYKMVNGVILSPVKLPLDIPMGTWHSLEVNCYGTYIECMLDGKKALPTITDTTPPLGKIGFWTKSDSVTYFADASVTFTPHVPMAQKIIANVMAKEPRIVDLSIYTLDAGSTNATHVIASKNAGDVGNAGEDSEKSAITDGSVFYGHARRTVVIILPFHDRNGDPMAAVRVELSSFLGETQDVALTRATVILKMMEQQADTSKELSE